MGSTAHGGRKKAGAPSHTTPEKGPQQHKEHGGWSGQLVGGCFWTQVGSLFTSASSDLWSPIQGKKSEDVGYHPQKCAL